MQSGNEKLLYGSKHSGTLRVIPGDKIQKFFKWQLLQLGQKKCQREMAAFKWKPTTLLSFLPQCIKFIPDVQEFQGRTIQTSIENHEVNNKVHHSPFKTPQNLGMHNSLYYLKKKQNLSAASQDWVFNCNERLVSRALIMTPTSYP